MKKILTLTAFLLFTFGFAQNPNYKTSLDSLLNYFYDNNAFSGDVVIQKNGKTIYEGNYNRFQNNSGLYRIGSITKISTAVVTFQLIEEGKLSLETKLNDYFPAIKNAENITIANMLNHTSGIYDYVQWKDYYTKKDKDITQDELLNLIKQGKPEFKPGKDSSYSNSNYMLLGFIIEKVTGKSFAENVKTRITDKIGLKNTYVETSKNEYAKRNSSYNFNGENWMKETETAPSFTSSAGAMISTANDLAVLIESLFNGKLVSEKSLQQMKKIDAKSTLGFGLQRTPFYKKEGYGHSGRVDEFHSFVGYFPEDSLAISILSNGTNIKLNEVALGIASKYYGKKYQYPDFSVYKSNTAPSADIYTGVYKAQLAGIITVGKIEITKAAKDHLFIRMLDDGANSEKALLVRTDENSFFARKYSSKFNFILDEKGKITGITMTQGKQSIKCKKIS